MKLVTVMAVILLGTAVGSAQEQVQPQPRTISILADKDSRYKIDGKTNPVLTLKAGEIVRLVITAIKAKSQNRDGSVHGFAMITKNGDRVPGWNLLLRPGVQEVVLQAPTKTGNYTVVCTVLCSSRHEDMHMTVVVE